MPWRRKRFAFSYAAARVLLVVNAGRALQTTARQRAGPMRVAVIGGGVAGCALAHGLREELAAGRVSVTLIEMGRGPGGRAATRTTRATRGCA